MSISGFASRMRRRRIGIVTRLGTGRVWSLVMMTMRFLPLTSSSSLGLPMALSRARSTISDCVPGCSLPSGWDSSTPRKFSSGTSIVILPLL